MRTKALMICGLLALPGLKAQQASLMDIHKGRVIRLNLPAGYCEAKVLQSSTDQILLKLKNTTAACGTRGAVVSVSGSDVRNVSRNRLSWSGRAGKATVMAAASVGLIVTGMALAFRTGNGALGAAVIVAGPISLWFLSPRPVLYDIFADRVRPQP